MSVVLTEDKEGIERIAQALILSNPDLQFRAGVAVLAHALGADNVRMSPNAPTLTQMVSAGKAGR